MLVLRLALLAGLVTATPVPKPNPQPHPVPAPAIYPHAPADAPEVHGREGPRHMMADRQLAKRQDKLRPLSHGAGAAAMVGARQRG